MGNAAWVDQDFAETRSRRRRETIREEMTAGEKIVWEGKPRLRWLFFLSLPLAVTGFAASLISWICLVESRGGAGILLIFPSLLVSIAMVFAPIWFVWRGVGTIYVITNRRAIIGQPLLIPGMQIRSYGPDSLGRMLRNQRVDGSGDLIFEEVGRSANRGRRFIRKGFLAVADVRRVETLLRETLLNHRAAR